MTQGGRSQVQEKSMRYCVHHMLWFAYLGICIMWDELFTVPQGARELLSEVSQEPEGRGHRDLTVIVVWLVEG